MTEQNNVVTVMDSTQYQLMEIEREMLLVHKKEDFWEIDWLCWAVNDLLRGKIITANTVRKWLTT